VRVVLFREGADRRGVELALKRAATHHDRRSLGERAAEGRAQAADRAERAAELHLARGLAFEGSVELLFEACASRLVDDLGACDRRLRRSNVEALRFGRLRRHSPAEDYHSAIAVDLRSTAFTIKGARVGSP
jgi:hypothetical protein